MRRQLGLIVAMLAVNLPMRSAAAEEPTERTIPPESLTGYWDVTTKLIMTTCPKAHKKPEQKYRWRVDYSRRERQISVDFSDDETIRWSDSHRMVVDVGSNSWDVYTSSERGFRSDSHRIRLYPDKRGFTGYRISGWEPIGTSLVCAAYYEVFLKRW